MKFLPISVIIPTFNRKIWVKRALQSVRSQTVLPQEIIVVDDGSTDGSSEYLRTGILNIGDNNSPKIHLLHQENLGVSAARNRGIAHSSGEWIAFLDSDDTWEPQKLEMQWHATQALGQNKAKIIHSNEVWIRNDRRVNPMDKHRKYDGWIYLHCLPRCCISPSSVMIHRSVLQDVGRFDEDLVACEDYDLWLRVCARYPVTLIPDNLVIKYGGHSDQLSRQHWGMDRFRIRALQNIARFGNLNHEFYDATVQTLQEKLLILRNGAQKRGHHLQAQDYQEQAERWISQGSPLTWPRVSQDLTSNEQT